MQSFTACSGVKGWRVGNQTPGCGGRLTLVVWTGEHRRPRVKAIESNTTARQTGQTLHSTTKTITEKEETP